MPTNTAQLSSGTHNSLDITPFIHQWIVAFRENRATFLVGSDFNFTDTLPTLSRALGINSAEQLPTIFHINLLGLADWEQACGFRCDTLPNWERLLANILHWLGYIRTYTDHLLYIHHIDIVRVENDVEPPEHARLGVDYFAYNSEEFESYTKLFSYQLSRACLNEQESIYSLTLNPEKISPDHVMLFASVPEASFYIYSSHGTNQQLLNLRFNTITTQTRRDITILFVTIIRNLSEHKALRECRIIIENSAFDKPDIRQEIHQEIIELLKKYNCHVLPHVFLLVEPNKNWELESPNEQDHVGVQFVPLKHSRGYYLSSPTIAATVLRTVQSSKPTPRLPERTHQASSPKERRNSDYVIKTASEKKAQYRESKQLDKTALKTSTCLTHTHLLEETQSTSNEHTQTQTMQQHETMDQAVTQQQQQQLNSGYFNPFRDKTSMMQFSRSLMHHARWRYELDRAEDDKLYHDNHFLTKHHHDTHFWRRISESQTVSDRITWTLYGRHYLGPEFRGLKHGSFIYMDNLIKDDILVNIKQLADGLDPSAQVIDKGPDVLAMTVHYRPRTLIGYSAQVTSHSKDKISTVLPILAKGSTSSGYQNLLSIPALLRDDDLALVTSEHKRTQLLGAARACIRLFDNKALAPDPNLALVQLRLLIAFHCKEKDLSNWDKFTEYLADAQREHLKIMTYLMVSGYSQKLQHFIDLLDCLADRDLLEHFYCIYFKYAQTITEVSDLLDIHVERSFKTSFSISAVSSKTSNISMTEETTTPQAVSPFLTLLMHTDPVDHKHEWVPYHTFAYHFLVHAARLNITICRQEMQSLKQTWLNIERMILAYTQQSTAESHRLLGLFVTHLCTQDGFYLQPVYCASTVLSGLENVISQAIKHNTLEEQLQEWGISLLWTDAVYMLTHDHFKVVTRDMQGTISKLYLSTHVDNVHISDQFMSSYAICENQLRALLHEQCTSKTGYETLHIKTFRYLGGTTLREPIAFYRALAHAESEQTDRVYTYFKQLLFTYFVLNHTGEYYTQDIETDCLPKNFMTFLRQKRYQTHIDQLASMPSHSPSRHQIMLQKIEGEYYDTIQICLRDFIHCLETLNYRALTGNQSLWTLYKDILDKTSSNNHTSTLGQLAHNLLDGVGLKPVPTSFATVPPVFKKAFATKQLSSFLLLNKQALSNCRHIYRAYPMLLLQLIKIKIIDWRTHVHQEIQANMPNDWMSFSSRFLFSWLQKTYPKLSIHDLTRDIPQLDALLEQYFILVLNKEIKQLWKPLVRCLEQHVHLSSAETLLSLINQLRREPQYQPTTMAQIFTALKNHQSLLKKSFSSHVLKLICTTYFVQPQFWRLTSHLKLAETLLQQSDGLLARDILMILLSSTPTDITEENCPFYLSKSLKLEQIKGLSALLKTNDFPLAVIQHVWEEHPHTEFTELNALLTTCQPNTVPHISSLALALYGHTDNALSMQALLIKMRDLPLPVAKQLAGLVTVHQLDITRVMQVLDSEDIPHQLYCLEHEHFNADTTRFNIDIARVKSYIADICYQSVPEGEEEQFLSPSDQAILLQDYQAMMSHMQTNPVLISTDIHQESRALALCELSEPQRKILYQRLSQKLQDNSLNDDKKHSYRLMLLALIAEAMLRSPVNKFPRVPQLLCQLHQLRDPNAQIQGIKTGGGKSIISEISALMLCADGWTVDIATENDVLAEVGLLKFSGLYDALGVPYAKKTIQPSTPLNNYIKGGIHHGTPAHFSFFRANVALKKKRIPKRVALLCDEIDATLTTTIQYRLAGVLDPIFQDLQAWSAVFKTLLDFVKDEARYLNNFCDKPEDVLNFFTYFKEQHHDKKLLDFIKILERNYKETICLLLDSSRVPEALSKSVDYRNIIKANTHEKDSQYAAPIMNVGTKRPEPSVRFGNGVQELLHEYCDGQLAPGEITFLKQAITQTLLVISAKNFFDQYRLNGGLIYGWTGTPGSPRALQEFAANHGLRAYYYPSFHPDQSEHLGITLVDGEEDVHAETLKALRERRHTCPDQPVLIITDSPRDMEAMHVYLHQHAPELLLQAYDGHSAYGNSEHGVVNRAGQQAIVTVSNPSLSRGTDIEGEVFLINTATDITEEEATQIEGRVARNGRLGQYCHIINRAKLTEETVSHNDSTDRFKAHQAIVSKHRQLERMKTRLLEDVRYFIVSKYILGLREEADTIYEQQYGSFASLISDTTLKQCLRDFNQALELKYTVLLGKKTQLSKEEEDDFIQASVEAYHEQQNKLLPHQALDNFQAVEPLIRLYLITNDLGLTIPDNLSLRHLTSLSELCANGWKAAGHQNVVFALHASDDVMRAFAPYFEDECSLRVATADALELRGLLHIGNLVDGISEIHTTIQNFDWHAAIFGTELELASETASFSITQLFPSEKIERLKLFFLDYLNTTKIQIHERRWDDITPPDFRVEWLQRWWANIKTLLTTLSYLSWGSAFAAGPVSFIITRFIVPPVFSCLKTLVKYLFADSESTMVQVLIGLDEAFEDIARAVTIFTQENPENMTVGELMDTLSPLLENQAILAIINKLGESQDWQMGSMLKILPEIMGALEKYRDRNIQELAEPEIVITVLKTLLKSDFIKNLIDDDVNDNMLERLESLPENFSTQFKDCRFEDLLKLLQVISHPKFYEFLSHLPPDGTYLDLNRWLNTENIDDLPIAIQAPKCALDTYQQDHERIAADTNQAFRNLKQTYHLQPNHISTHRAALLPKFKEKPPETPELSHAMFVLQWLEARWLSAVIAYTTLLVFNLALFQLNAVIITSFFAVAVLTSMGHALLTHMASIKLPDVFPGGIAPPLNEHERELETENAPAEQHDMSAYTYPRIAHIMKFGLFCYDSTDTPRNLSIANPAITAFS
tara:strand:- start:149642 stop:158230 length:8589 start_codon:yes stop_codon:yes gene_type:complete